MRSRRKLIVSSVMFLLLMAVASGTVLVRRAAAAYAGVCDPLDGFPGALQRAGFVPKGTCRVNRVDDTCPPTACDIGGKEGHCRRQTIDKRVHCVCTPDRISR
jgi:hypothetical protein